MGTFVIVLLILLLLFSDRLAGAGRGLGEAVKNFKRSVRSDDPSTGPKAPAPLAPVVTRSPPKLLPAKGETTPSSNEPQSDDESEKRKA